MIAHTDGDKKNVIKIVMITNHLIEPYIAAPLIKMFANISYEVDLSFILYEVYAEQENNDYLINADILFVWIDIELLFSKKKEIALFDEDDKERILLLFEQIYNYVTAKNEKKILWMSTEHYFDNTWNYCGAIKTCTDVITVLNQRVTKLFTDAIVIDLEHLIAIDGIKNAFEHKHTEFWNIKYSKALIKHVAEQICKYFMVTKGITYKCIVTDCDNVLWKGVISESDIKEISVCGVYKSYQNELLRLYKRGIILCIASKNDIKDVDKVFEHCDDMIIIKDNIACQKINWDDKVANIVEIAKTLNIGLDSLVFIDDNPYEIENVKLRLPEIYTILFDNDIKNKLSIFNLPCRIDDENALIRQLTYKKNVLRAEVKESVSYDEYLQILNSQISIRKASEHDIERIVELSHRTNKCTNGARYSIDELLSKKNDYTIYVVTLSDNFGDLGTVGAMIIEENENSSLLKLFCLSCRALGRNVEKQMLDFLRKNEKICSVFFQDTGKNQAIYTLMHQLL